MRITEIEGNLFSSGCTVICHQVNCQGVMGSGVAKGIKLKWPIVFEQYNNFLENNIIFDRGRKINTGEFLGLCQIVKVGDNQYVANLFAQNYFGKDGRQYTDYEALRIALYSLKRLVLFGNYGITSLAFPYGMGAGLGGGNWDIVRQIIVDVFGDLDIDIEIRKLN